MKLTDAACSWIARLRLMSSFMMPERDGNSVLEFWNQLCHPIKKINLEWRSMSFCIDLFLNGVMSLSESPYLESENFVYGARTDRRFKLAMSIFTAMAAEVGLPQT